MNQLGVMQARSHWNVHYREACTCHNEQGIPQCRVQCRRFQTLAAGWHIAAGVPRKVHYDDTERRGGEFNLNIYLYMCTTAWKYDIYSYSLSFDYIHFYYTNTAINFC